MSLGGFSAIQPNETIVVQTPTITTNAYGDEHVDWDDPVERTVMAIVWPRTADEDNDKRHATITGISIAVDIDEVIRPDERVVVRGRIWEVDGMAADWRAPWGWTPGKVVNLRQVEG